jgi:hypothetical protein
MVGLENKEVERIWKEVVRGKFKIISPKFSCGTEDNHKNLQPE